MRLLFRFGIFFVIAGFVAGLLLRRVRPGRLPEAILVAALPWFVHLVYALVWAISTYGAVLGAVIVGLIDLALTVAILRAGPRAYRPDTRRAALVPLALLALHGVLLWVWTLFGDVSFRTLPNLYLVAGTLLVASALFSYGLPTPRPFLRRR